MKKITFLKMFNFFLSVLQSQNSTGYISKSTC